jgi:hypothetical protein
MTLRLARDLPAPPEAVWPYVADPRLINLWSTAAVEETSPGDGGRPGSVGTLRTVTVPKPGIDMRFEEVIEHSEPPDRLVYRVIGNRLVRYHRGEIRLEGHGDQTRLTWEVDYVFALPGMSSAVSRLLRPDLERSLRHLTTTVRGAPARPANGTPQPEDESELPQLFAEADRIILSLRALADDLEANGDARHWFARVYEYVTACQLEACRDGTSVTHRAWAMRLIPRFFTYFADNLGRASGEAPDQVEAHWAVAFSAIESGAGPGGSALVFWRSLIEGARAHIEGDLPRVLADVYRDHYAARCDYVRFRADFLLMAPIFSRAWDRLKERVPRAYLPAWMRAMDRLAPPEVVEAITAKRMYDPLLHRRIAFERGREFLARG